VGGGRGWVGVGSDGESGVVGGGGLVRVERGKVADVGIFDEERTPVVVVGYGGEELAVFGGGISPPAPAGAARTVGYEGGGRSEEERSKEGGPHW